MQLNELNSMLSTLLADSSTNFFTQAERLQALNAACSYVNGELRLLRDVASITVTPLDEGRIALPVDFVSMGQGVLWEEQSGQRTALSRKTALQLETSNAGWQLDVGTPQSYVMEGGQIYLTPTPTQAGIVHISYVPMPNKLLEDTDIPFYGDVRTQSHHDMLAFYAAWMLTLKDRDFEAAQQFMSYFQSRFIDLKENLRHTGQIGEQPVWSDTYSTT